MRRTEREEVKRDERDERNGRRVKTVRLDKYLKISRLIKRRTVANEACDSERILVNGKEQKPGYRVKPGDIIELNLGRRVLKVEVVSTEENVSKADAAAMYREIG